MTSPCLDGTIRTSVPAGESVPNTELSRPLCIELLASLLITLSRVKSCRMSKMRIWRLIAHHRDPDSAIAWFQNQRRITIGWSLIGDLRVSQPQTAKDISDMIHEKYPTQRNAQLGGPSLWRFYDEMRVGDLVIVSDGHRRRLVMEVDSDYQWDSTPSQVAGRDYQHWRGASVVLQNPDELWRQCGSGPASGENIRWTLARCSDSTAPLT